MVDNARSLWRRWRTGGGSRFGEFERAARDLGHERELHDRLRGTEDHEPVRICRSTERSPRYHPTVESERVLRGEGAAAVDLGLDA
jgi:hypothetical protein